VRACPVLCAFPLLFLCLSACAATPAPGAAASVDVMERVTTMRLLGGIRELDDDDWEPLESHVLVGVELDSYRPADPIGFELGGSFSEDEESDSAGADFIDGEVDAFEIYAGARKTWHATDGLVRPYLGAGLTFISGEVEVEGSIAGIPFSGSDDDSTLGFYAHAGLAVFVSERVSLGADLRGVLGAEFDDLDGDYLQAAGFLAMTL